ncbi:MAG: glycine cleavage system aminomethyltransferase GcvT [Sphingomonadales bacterium]
MSEESTETLPLDSWHRARGARMVPFAGYAMPIQYDGIVAEHLWTRESAGLFDVSHMGQLLISGDGAGEALEALLPSDITGIGPNKVRYSLLLDENGGILDDLMVTNRADGFYVIVNGAVKHEDIGHLREHLPDEITINHMEDRALIAVQGPKAVAAVARVIPGVEAMYFMESAGFGDLWISRSGYTGEDGVEISVPSENVEALVEALCAQPEIKPIGLGARDSLRLEAGLPLYGHDLSTEVDPVEGQLTFAIQKRRREGGGFPGAARIQKNLAQGPATKRVGLSVEGRLPAREGADIYLRDALIGKVTSGGFSPSLQAPIAMGYVDAAHAAINTSLEIDVRGKRLAATVVPMPFVPHRYHRKGAA